MSLGRLELQGDRVERVRAYLQSRPQQLKGVAPPPRTKQDDMDAAAAASVAAASGAMAAAAGARVRSKPRHERRDKTAERDAATFRYLRTPPQLPPRCCKCLK